MAQHNPPGYVQWKAPLDQKLLSMVFHNRSRRVDSTLSSTIECYENKRRVLDAPYRIPGVVVPGSAALAGPPLRPDSKSLLSESDIFATSARGS